MAQYQSPINALLSQLPQLAMQMYGASREDKYRDKELEFQEANTAFSQNMQNKNLAIAQGNAEQNRLNAVAQRNLYASQQAEADRNFKNADLSRVLFGNGTDDLPDEYSDMDTDNDKIVDLGESNNYTLLQELLVKRAQIDASEATREFTNLQRDELVSGADTRKKLTELDIESKETANEQNKINLAMGKFQRDSLLARGVLNNVTIPGVQPWYGDVRAAPDPKKIGKKEGRLLNPIEAIKFVFNKKDTNIQPIVELYRNKDEVINQWVSASKNSGLSESLIRDSAEEKWNEMASGIVDRISVQILLYDGEKAQADFLDRIEKAGLSFKRGDAALSGGNQFGNQVQMPQRQQY